MFASFGIICSIDFSAGSFMVMLVMLLITFFFVICFRPYIVESIKSIKKSACMKLKCFNQA